MFHEELRLVERDRLDRASLKTAGDKINRPAVEARLGRFVAEVVAVVVVDEEHVARTPGDVAAVFQ